MRMPMDCFWSIDPLRLPALRGPLLELQRRGCQLPVATPPSPPLVRGGAQSDAGAKPEASAGERVLYHQVGAVAVVAIDGPMLKNPPDWAIDALGFASTKRTQRAVEAAAADPAVSAILLRVDTPGGSVDGLPELADAIAAAAAVKPVVAQVDGLMASAGYYVGSQATRILAHGTDLVGSIGTIICLYDYSKLFAEAGIEAVPIATGPYKATGMIGAELTADQRTYLQGIVDFFFADFKARVQRGRRLSNEGIAAVTDGRVFPAPEAQRLGLIDGTATLDATLAELVRQEAERARARTARAKAGFVARQACAVAIAEFIVHKVPGPGLPAADFSELGII